MLLIATGVATIEWRSRQVLQIVIKQINHCTDDGRVRSCRQQSITVVVAAVRETVVDSCRAECDQSHSSGRYPVATRQIAAWQTTILRCWPDHDWVGCCRSDHDSANSNRPSLARSLPGQRLLAAIRPIAIGWIAIRSRPADRDPIAIGSRSDRDRADRDPIAIRRIAIRSEFRAMLFST